MTISEQLQQIVDGLADFAQENKAQVKIAHDVPHLFKILGDGPGACRVAILFAGEVCRGGDLHSDISGRADRKFWIAFSRGYTLESYAGKSLVEGVAGGKPMFDLIEEGRTAIREIQFTGTDEPIPYYKSIELLTFEGVTLDAYRVEIEVAADIGNNLDNPETAFPET